MRAWAALVILLATSSAEARIIEEASIPFTQVCVTRAAGRQPQATLRFQTADAAGVIVDDQTIAISSALMTDAERLQVKTILDAAFLRLHGQLGVPTPTATPEPTPTPTPGPTP